MMTQRRISPRSVLLTASLLVLIADAQAGAQRRPDRAKLPGFIESTWKPVRDGGAEVVAIEVRTELKGLPDSLGRSLRVIPMRGGFTSVDEYGRDVNRAFKDYYTNVARNLSADSIVKIGFGDGSVRHIPYVRGALYFADLDSKIRAYSGNKRNLDNVMFDVFQARERGEPFTHETWKQIVVRAAGPNAADEFERIILKGETLLPASDAFGPCFERRPAKSMSDGKELEIFEWVRVCEHSG